MDYFPRYALDPSLDYRPAKSLAAVLAVFRGLKSDWGVAYWFASVNSFLGGKRPQDLLLQQPDRVVAAAEDAIAGVQRSRVGPRRATPAWPIGRIPSGLAWGV